MRLLILENDEVEDLYDSGDLLTILLCEIWTEGVFPETLEYIVLKNRFSSSNEHLALDVTNALAPFESINDNKLIELIVMYTK